MRLRIEWSQWSAKWRSSSIARHLHPSLQAAAIVAARYSSRSCAVDETCTVSSPATSLSTFPPVASLARCSSCLDFVCGWRRCRWLQAPNQFTRIDVQALGELENVVERNVAPAPLNLADEGPVQPAGVGQFFLALSSVMSMSSDAVTEGFRRCRDGLCRHDPQLHTSQAYESRDDTSHDLESCYHERRPCFTWCCGGGHGRQVA